MFEDVGSDGVDAADGESEGDAVLMVPGKAVDTWSRVESSRVSCQWSSGLSPCPVVEDTQLSSVWSCGWTHSLVFPRWPSN